MQLKPLLTSISRQLALTATFAMITGGVSAADPPAAFTGKWVLNVQKSNFGSDPPLKSEVFTITDPGDGKWHSTVDYVEGDASVHVEYTTAADGKAVPVTGTTEVDSAIVKKVDASTVTFAFLKSGKRIEWGTDKLSKDSNTLREEIAGFDPDGKIWKWHYLFDRQ